MPAAKLIRATPPYPTAEPSTEIPPGTTLRNEDTAGFFVRYYKAFPAPDRAAWQLQIAGLVDAPTTLTLAQIRSELPYYESNRRMACVEGWSSRATWGGFTFADLAVRVRPQATVMHVR